MLKRLVSSVIGPENVGRLDCLLGRHPRDAWGGPLNGQMYHRRIYADIIERIPFAAIVETGTFRGTTTEFFAQSGLPVYSVEIDPRAHGFAVQRLAPLSDRVRLFKGNSPEFLRTLVASKLKGPLFFYLDAHVQDAAVYHKAPLVEELDIVFGAWPDSVVMVDDFRVPGDQYTYDDWGPGKSLDLESLKPLAALRLAAFFPAAQAAEETGAKRGCVVLARDEFRIKTLKEVATLRQFASL